MGRTGWKLIGHLAALALTVIATPTVAAGLIASTSAAAEAGTETIGHAIYPKEYPVGPAINSDSSPFIATHGPAKLSVLAGNDEAAWESAHSVHVDFRRKPH